MEDLFRKGYRKTVSGETHYRAVLTWDDVFAIRSDYASGVKRAALARKFGVTFQNIDAIVKNKTWRDSGRLPGLLELPNRPVAGTKPKSLKRMVDVPTRVQDQAASGSMVRTPKSLRRSSTPSAATR